MNAKFLIKDHYHSDPKSSSKIKLCIYGRQNEKSWEEGHDIKKFVSNPLCDHWLDYFLDHQEKIPNEWKGKLIFFWGTIYTLPQSMPLIIGSVSKDGTPNKNIKSFKYNEQYVRCLYNISGNNWACDFLSLNDEFGPTRVSAEYTIKHTFLSNLSKMWTKLIRYRN